jgi:hypothetical protein
VCPLIVAQLHNALLRLGPQASKVQIVAVSVDPMHDTPKTVTKFLAAHEMTGRMEYLIGSLQRLAPVWKLYGIVPSAERSDTQGSSTRSRPAASGARSIPQTSSPIGSFMTYLSSRPHEKCRRRVRGAPQRCGRASAAIALAGARLSPT